METWGSSGDEITLLELNQFVGMDVYRARLFEWIPLKRN